MRKTTKMFAAMLATVAMTGQAFAAGVCSRAEETSAVKAEVLQQQLMVAAYSCSMPGAYNAFVINYRPDLVADDATAQGLFKRASASGEADYQTFKTKLANDFSLDSQHDDGFCDNAKDMFQTAAEHRGESLNAMMAALDFDGDTPFNQCDRREAAVMHKPSPAPVVADDSDMVEGGSSGAVSARAVR